MVGKSLSHYKIEAELGRGGMGIVYKAEDTKLDRTVAIKVLPSAALASEDDRARFYREAKAAAQLHHPHIASVFEIDEAVPDGSKDDDLRPFIAMEYIDGETLEDRIAKGPFKLEAAVRIAIEVASGLQLAHENDIVHRDIKSANIMLTSKNVAKVLDFGLAQTAASTKLTRLGSTLGTVAYMSPEQARGEEVDSRTDIWALGAVLYEMISGTTAFPGTYEQAVVYSILNQDPEPLTAVRTGVPMELERITKKCLAKEATLRYQHCDDLIADLNALAPADLKSGSGSGTIVSVPDGDQTSGPEPVLQKKWVLPAAVIVTAVFASLATFFGTRGTGTYDQIQIVSRDRITIESTVELHPSIHPAGDRVIYAAGHQNSMRLYYRSIKGGIATKLVENSTGDENYPSYSPDGNLVLFESQGSIYTVEELGGVKRMIVKPRLPGDVYAFPTWSPDGESIAYISNGDSVHFQHLIDAKPYLSIASDRSHSLAWSPDGRFLAFVKLNSFHARRGNNYAPSSVWLVDAKSGEERRVTSDKFMDQSPRWAPDMSGLFFISNRGGGLDLYRQPISDSGIATGDPDRLTVGSSLHSIDIAADGTQIVVSDLIYRQNIWASDLDTGSVVYAREASRITSGDQVIEGVSLSPDGTQIAYDSNARGLAHLFVMSLDGGTPSQVSFRDSPDFLYDWSPHSDALAFHTFRGGTRDVGILSGDYLTTTMIGNTSDNELWPFWLGDENTLAYHVFTGTETLYNLVRTQRDAQGLWGEPEVIVADSYLGASFSDVRNQIAYISPDGMFVQDPETGATQMVDVGDLSILTGNRGSDTARFAAWSEDGSLIYFLAQDDNGKQSIWAVSSDGGSPSMVVDFLDSKPGLVPPAIGGNRMYYTISETDSDIWVMELRRENAGN